MANSRQSATIFSPSSKRPTKRTRSSITEHSFQGIASSPRGGSVTYVSGTNCHPCVGSLICFKQLQSLGRAFGCEQNGPCTDCSIPTLLRFLCHKNVTRI